MKNEQLKLKRYDKNPILGSNSNHLWDGGAVFNCGATVIDDGKVVLLYRAVAKGYERKPGGKGYVNYISRIGYAESDDGIHFVCRDTPLMIPDTDYDLFGCEDPRVTRFKDSEGLRYFITYTAMSAPAFSGRGDRVAVASTRDFVNVEKHGKVIPDLSDKDAVIFPERVNGKIVMFHRIEPNIQIVSFNSFEEIFNPNKDFWRKYLTRLDDYVVLEKKYEWETQKVGSGPPPLKTDEGWLLFYHSVDKNSVYRCGVALLDLDDPSRVIARSPAPVLEPEEDYEKYGDVNNVVFPEGAVLLGGTVFLYYGAADTCCALATVKLQEILDYLGGCKV